MNIRNMFIKICAYMHVYARQSSNKYLCPKGAGFLEEEYVTFICWFRDSLIITN